LGDGISALGLLDRLLDAASHDPLPERSAPVRQPTSAPQPTRVVTGLLSLASRGTAPAHRLNRHGNTGRRDMLHAQLPWPDVRRVAKLHDAQPHELMVGLIAEVLCRYLVEAGWVRRDK